MLNYHDTRLSKQMVRVLDNKTRKVMNRCIKRLSPMNKSCPIASSSTKLKMARISSVELRPDRLNLFYLFPLISINI